MSNAFAVLRRGAGNAPAVAVTPTPARARHRHVAGSAAAPVPVGLDLLASEWTVLDKVTAGPVALDTMVVGPGGVYTVTTVRAKRRKIKVDGDKVTIDRHTSNVVIDARVLADIASTNLSKRLGCLIPVTGLVLVEDAKKLDIVSQPEDELVQIGAPGDVLRWLRRRPEELTEFGIEQVQSVVTAVLSPFILGRFRDRRDRIETTEAPAGWKAKLGA